MKGEPLVQEVVYEWVNRVVKSVVREKTIVCGRWWDNDKINRRRASV